MQLYVYRSPKSDSNIIKEETITTSLVASLYMVMGHYVCK